MKVANWVLTKRKSVPTKKAKMGVWSNPNKIPRLSNHSLKPLNSEGRDGGVGNSAVTGEAGGAKIVAIIIHLLS
jgi:hypothetical protein